MLGFIFRWRDSRISGTRLVTGIPGAASHCRSSAKWQIARFVHVNDEKVGLEEIRMESLA